MNIRWGQDFAWPLGGHGLLPPAETLRSAGGADLPLIPMERRTP